MSENSQAPVIYAPTAIDVVKSMVSDYFREQAASGTKFKAGELIKFGWFYFRIIENEDQPEVWGPDLKSFPLQWDRDISLVLNLLLLQKYVVESYGYQMTDCDLNQTAVVSKSFGERQDYFLNRMGPAQDTHSGWYLGFVNDTIDVEDPENFTTMSLYEISLEVPNAIRFWMLPPNTQVINPGDHADILEDYQPITPLEGSYMWNLQK